MKDKLTRGLCCLVWPLGVIFSKSYDGILDNIVHGHTRDVTLPFGIYFINKLFNHPLGESKFANASYAFLGCSMFEISQRTGLYPGIFDPKDFLAYATGAGLAIAVDKLTSKKKNLENIN